MKLFRCVCGQRVFFDSGDCTACGRQLGFDPEKLAMVAISDPGQRCSNGIRYGFCNWVLPEGSHDQYCLACGLNEMIPNLNRRGNLELWARLEVAKRRLLYNLLSLNLPFSASDRSSGLRFRFMEDRRRNPDVLEDFVATGHQAGTITINLGEADNVHRTVEREAVLERYRTVLGHFRHESGHYYFSLLIESSPLLAEWRALFGDERQDYAAALAKYYREGPAHDWAATCISPYASAHPHEDWAECFSHYLHIVDALETASTAGIVNTKVTPGSGWIPAWMELSVTLNEISRSLGTDDPYPFVLTNPVVAKLEFIDRLVHRQVA